MLREVWQFCVSEGVHFEFGWVWAEEVYICIEKEDGVTIIGVLDPISGQHVPWCVGMACRACSIEGSLDVCEHVIAV